MHTQADTAIIEKTKPYDQGQGWIKTDDGQLEPLWSYGPVLPLFLIDILETIYSSDEAGNEEVDLTDDIIEFDYLIESKDECKSARR